MGQRGFVLPAVHGMLSSAPVLRMTKAGEGHEMLCVIQQVSEQQNCSVDRAAPATSLPVNPKRSSVVAFCISK